MVTDIRVQLLCDNPESTNSDDWKGSFSIDGQPIVFDGLFNRPIRINDKILLWNFTNTGADFAWSLAVEFENNARGYLSSESEDVLAFFGFYNQMRGEVTKYVDAVFKILGIIEVRGYIQKYRLLPENGEDIWNNALEKDSNKYIPNHVFPYERTEDNSVGLIVLDSRYKTDTTLQTKTNEILESLFKENQEENV